LDGESRRTGPEARISVVVNDSELALNAGRAGLGRSLLPCRIGDGVPELSRLSGAKPVLSLSLSLSLSREMWLIAHPDLKQLARVRAVMAWIERLFSERPAALQTKVTDARRLI
jgi:DNA-binding transcriptional LysR family regulator